MTMSTTASRDAYVMSRDTLASGRLTAQHFLLLRRLGWLLHPEIEAQMRVRKTFEVADVACGNGVWSLDMAQQFPQARITGIDISPQQFPVPSTWPANVSMELHDIFHPMPQRYVGRFDVVHVRLIMAAVYWQDKDWVIHNILNLLRPGGWIQWTDAPVPLLQATSDIKNGAHLFREPPAITTQLSGLFAQTEWLRQLPQELYRHSLINLRDVAMPPVPWLSRQDTDNAMWAITDIRDGLKQRAAASTAETFARAVEETLEDIRRGRSYYTTFCTTIGQKPG
jgi:2-polyprenyl-3-methyl-5-hydroxy-6-metoxy-1,4-benzoquinol methylase